MVYMHIRIEMEAGTALRKLLPRREVGLHQRGSREGMEGGPRSG